MSKLKINLKDKSYEILIENGIINNIIKYIKTNKNIFIITDENVNSYYGNIVESSLLSQCNSVHKIVLPAGENSKSINFLNEIYEKLIGFGITRSDLIISLGGGVIGDLAGFAAGTILRGVPFIQIPTSLLSQVDSSIGGKTGINLSSGKNLVGMFNHPNLVLIDPNVLKTLPEREIKSGLGEIIKYGCIKDASIFENINSFTSINNLMENISEIIFSSLQIKGSVVENDERDTGERMILNFGHTLGHGIEKYYNYEYTHGEAVGIGMYEITALSEKHGLTTKGTSEKIKNLMVKYNLSYSIPKEDRSEILKYVFHDKKILNNTLNIVLLKEIGNSFIYPLEKNKIIDFFEI